MSATYAANNRPQSFKGNFVTGSCCLISKNRFVIVNTKYHVRMLDIFKTIASSSYDKTNQRWSFHLKDYGLLMSSLQDLKGEVSIGGLPQVVLKTFRDYSENVNREDIDFSKIDSKLIDSLFPFQKDGICFGISKHGRCLIADDMGLGKTIQALGIAHYYKEDWPLLIVCPSSVRYLWSEAIETWLPSVPAHHIMVMTSGKDHLVDTNILITSYDLLARHIKLLNGISFGAVILDECHFIKCFKSARTKAALVFLKKAKRVLLLSGTPALSRPNELFTQVSAIDPKLFPSFQDYGIRYCNGTKNQWGWDYSGASNMEELHLLLEHSIMIRRLKSDVIKQLPAKIRQVIILNPSSIKGNTSKMKSCLENMHLKHLKGMERRGALLTYYCETGQAKLKAIMDYITDLIDSDKKFICFAHHVAVLDGICDAIYKKKRECIRIDGSTNSNMRKLLCDKFQYEKKYVAAVLSITAANAGITLTAAHLVVFAELFWNPGILTQAEDRAHRIGQQDSVVVQYLVARGTADDFLWPLIQNKLNVLNKAGLSKDNFLDSDATEMKDPKQSTMQAYFQELEDSVLPSWDSDGVNMDELMLEVDLDKLVEIENKRIKLDTQ